MTTGTLKFASLLIVIVTGGGVAWQAQQGILQQPKASQTAEAEDTTDETVDQELAADLGEATPTLIDSPSPTPNSADWDDDADMSAVQLAAAPGKFQRKTIPARSTGAPIPARNKSKNSEEKFRNTESARADVAENEVDDAVDPFAEESPAPSHRPPKLTPIPETEPVEEDEEAATAPAGSSNATADNANYDVTDEMDGTGPLLLVGHDQPKRSSRGRKPAKAEPEATSEEEALGSADDPFANSAPPDGEADGQSEDKASESVELPESLADEETDHVPSLELPAESSLSRTRTKDTPPSDEANADFGAEPFEFDATPKLDLPTEDPADEPAASMNENAATPRRNNPSTHVDPFSGSDPNLGETTESTPDEPSADDSAPKRSQRMKGRGEDTPAEKQPGLLPLPESPPKDADADSLEQPAAPPIDSNDPSPRTFLEEEPLGNLDGDAVPDASAPKGVQQPRLTIEKIAPKQAVLRQPLVYSIVVKNTGSADAHHVTVEDRIPKGTTLVGTAPQAELFDKRLVWKLGSLRPDEHRKISIKVIPEQQGPIGSVAKVNFVAEIAAEIEITAPQVVLTVESPSQVRLGDKLHMVFKVRNAGGADAENVVIRNLIPDGLRHPAGSDLEYAMGTLAAQDTQEIKLDLIATKNGKVTNQTIITGDHGVKVEEETPVEVIGEQLLLTRTGKSKVYVDKSAVFTSTVANEGTAPASRVNVAEVVPAGFEFVSASNKGHFDPATRAITWSIGPIGPGEELKLSTQLMPKRTGDYRSTITVTGPAGSVATVDAELKVEGHAAVGLDSKIDTRLISVGEQATVRIHCKNQGTALARNLILSAELPPELKLVTGKGQTDWDHQGNMVTFEAIPALQPNETASFELQVEGVAEGDTVIELKFAADHLKRPLQRDETLRVAAGGD